MLDRLRQTFELHGFASVETRAVEPLDRLAKQGEIDKEVYAVPGCTPSRARAPSSGCTST